MCTILKYEPFTKDIEQLKKDTKSVNVERGTVKDRETKNLFFSEIKKNNNVAKMFSKIENLIPYMGEGERKKESE